MSYIDVLKQTQNVMTPGSSACQGCGSELILRRVMQQLPTAASRAFPEPPSAEQRCFMSAMTTKAT